MFCVEKFCLRQWARDDLLLLLSRSSSRDHCRKHNFLTQNMNKHQLIQSEMLVNTLIFVLVVALMQNGSRCVNLPSKNHTRVLSTLVRFQPLRITHLDSFAIK